MSWEPTGPLGPLWAGEALPGARPARGECRVPVTQGSDGTVVAGAPWRKPRSPPGGNPARRLRARAALGWNASDPAHEARDLQQVAETVQASASILPSEDGQQQEPILPGAERCTQPPQSSLSGRAAVSIVFRAVAPVASMEAAAEGARAIGRVTPG